MRARMLVALCVLAAVLGGAAEARAQQVAAEVALPREIERVLRDYEAAWTARDASRLAALFHADGFVLSPGRAPVRGREAIASHYARAGGELHLAAIDYVAADTVAYVVGLYRGAEPGPQGKFVLALRRARAGDPWLIGADMDNGNSR